MIMLNQKVRNLEAELSQKEELVAKLREQLLEADSGGNDTGDSAQLQDEIMSLRTKLEDAMAENKQMREELRFGSLGDNAESDNVEELRLEIQNQNIKIASLEDIKREKDKRIKELTGEKEKLTKALEAEKKRYSELEKDSSDVQSSADKDAENLKQVQEELNETKSQLEQAENEKIMIRSELTDAKGELETLREQLQTAKKSAASAALQEECDHLQEKVNQMLSEREEYLKSENALKAELEKARTAVTSVQFDTKELTELRMQNGELTARCEDLESAVAHERSLWEEEKVKLVAEAKQAVLDKQSSDKSEIIAKLKEEIETLTEERDNAHKEYNTLMEEKQECLKNLSAVKNEKAESEAQISILQSKINALEQQDQSEMFDMANIINKTIESTATIVNEAKKSAATVKEAAEKKAEMLKLEAQQQARSILDNAKREAEETSSEIIAKAEKIQEDAVESSRVMIEQALRIKQDANAAIQSEAVRINAEIKDMQNAVNSQLAELIGNLQNMTSDISSDTNCIKENSAFDIIEETNKIMDSLLERSSDIPILSVQCKEETPVCEPDLEEILSSDEKPEQDVNKSEAEIPEAETPMAEATLDENTPAEDLSTEQTPAHEEISSDIKTVPESIPFESNIEKVLKEESQKEPSDTDTIPDTNHTETPDFISENPEDLKEELFEPEIPDIPDLPDPEDASESAPKIPEQEKAQGSVPESFRIEETEKEGTDSVRAGFAGAETQESEKTVKADAIQGQMELFEDELGGQWSDNPLF